MNIKLTEKLQKFAKAAEQNQDEEYERMLNSWGKQIVKSEAWASYCRLPMSQEIVAALVRAVKTINQKLVNDPQIDQSKRAAYMADKQRCLWLIKHLSHNFARDLKMIEMSIDSELQELE